MVKSGFRVIQQQFRRKGGVNVLTSVQQDMSFILLSRVSIYLNSSIKNPFLKCNKGTPYYTGVRGEMKGKGREETKHGNKLFWKATEHRTTQDVKHTPLLLCSFRLDFCRIRQAVCW